MYGLLIESVADFIRRKYGNATWDQVRKKAKIDNHSFSTHQQYSETFFLRAIKALAEIVGKYYAFHIETEFILILIFQEFLNI